MSIKKNNNNNNINNNSNINSNINSTSNNNTFLTAHNNWLNNSYALNSFYAHNFKTDLEFKLFNRHFRFEAFFLFHTLYKSLSKKGKLSKAKKIVGRISYLIKIENFSLSFIFLHQAFSYIRPLLGFKSQSKLKFNQKPLVIPLSLAQSYRLAIRWLIEGANQRSERTMALRIYNELQDAFNKKGYVFKKKNMNDIIVYYLLN